MTILSQILRPPAFAALIGAVTLTCLVLRAPLRAALPDAQQIAFTVLRGGTPLGHHKVMFRREADALHVEIDIELEVKLAFLTVFRYHHRNHEVWQDGRLLAIAAETDDDGERYWLRGRAEGAGLRIEGSGGSILAPADIMPTSYWNPETVNRSRLLDTQRGQLIDVDIEPVGRDIVTLANGPVPAQRYRMTGDLTLDLWYTADGKWAKISFEARGVEVVYARHGAPADPTVIEGVATDQ